MLHSGAETGDWKPMRVAIECRFHGGGKAGGIGHVSIGLARGLSALEGSDKYIFLVNGDFEPLIRPYIGNNCELVVVDAARENPVKSFARRIPFVQRGWEAVRSDLPPKVPESDGTVERLNVELVHFINQSAFKTAVPSIYQPHDLQHMHYPEYFTKQERQRRTLTYKYFCDQARLVVVSSSWTAMDVHRQLHVPSEKIAVVAFAPPSLTYEKPSTKLVGEMRHRIGGEFIFYPAQTWPHKNHLNLILALKTLRDRGVVVPLVCSGYQNAFYKVIENEVIRLKMSDQVTFLGFVDDQSMRCLFDLCSFVVIPTKFEAESLPIWEAFVAQKAVVASAVTSLPQQVGNGGLTFNPDDVDQIAECIEELWRNQLRRQALAKNGFDSVKKFTWERSAQHFRSHYKRILGQSLTQAEREMLSEKVLI
jgi:glycosyltransferase involved in cell wall biosynthesis